MFNALVTNLPNAGCSACPARQIQNAPWLVRCTTPERLSHESSQTSFSVSERMPR